MSEFSTLNGYKVKDKKATRFYDNVESMKSDTTLKEGMHVITKGYYTINDGGGSHYHITSIESQTDFQEELNNGFYASLIVKDYIKPEMLGAYGDGVHDDYESINNSILYGDTILFSNKNYKCNSTITINKSCKFLGVKNSRTVEERNYIDFSESNDNECFILNTKGIVFENLNIKGLRNKHIGFTIENNSRYTFRNCGFYYLNKAIYTDRAWSTSFYDCVFEYCETCVEFNDVNTSFLFSGTIFYSSTNGIISNQELDYSNIIGGGFDHVDTCINLATSNYANNITLVNVGFEDYITGIIAIGNCQATVISCTFVNTERTVETYKGAGKINVITSRTDNILTPNKQDVIYISPITSNKAKISSPIVSTIKSAYAQAESSKFYDFAYPVSNGSYLDINYESGTEFDVEINVASTNYPETFHFSKYSSTIAKTQGDPATFSWVNDTTNNRIRITFNTSGNIRVKGYMKYSGSIS